jgi:hypothetical protein
VVATFLAMVLATKLYFVDFAQKSVAEIEASRGAGDILGAQFVQRSTGSARSACSTTSASTACPSRSCG